MRWGYPLCPIIGTVQQMMKSPSSDRTSRVPRLALAPARVSYLVSYLLVIIYILQREEQGGLSGAEKD